MEVMNQCVPPTETIEMKVDNSLGTSIREELNRLPLLSSSSSIYRVPHVIRRVNIEAYEPQFVSIGPLHHGKEGLQAMEEHKKRYLHDYLCRTEVNLEHFLNKIKNQEGRLRGCYAEPIGFNSDEFSKIILVDAAFIIEFLLRFHFHEFDREGDHIFNKPWMYRYLWDDVWMLENQLPFFILEDLFEEYIAKVSSTGSDFSKKVSLMDISQWFSTAGITNEEDSEQKWKKIISCYSSSIHVEHFVDLMRTFYLPLGSKLNDQSVRGNTKIPCVTELHQAGIKFKVGPTENIIDIHFSNGILEIPKIIISRHSIRKLKNMIVFEQCHCLHEGYINGYVKMLGRLVSTHKDVGLLIEYGIIEYRNSDSALEYEINKLASQVAVFRGRFYYGKLCDDLSNHCKSPWNKWKANLKQNYFNTPWASISVIGAVVLLILTLIQAVCSVVSIT